MRNQTFSIKKVIMSLFIVLAMTCAMFSSLGASEALAQSSSAPTKVDIELEVDAPSQDIKLGEEHNRVFEVKNIEDSAYIRLIPSLRLNGEAIEKHQLDLSNDWIKAGDGYYYYTKPMNGGDLQSISARILFDGTEPYIIDMATGDDVSLIETVTAEAIQSHDMYPDFSADEPWKDAYKGSYEPSTDTENKDMVSGSGLQQTGDRTDLMSWVILAGIALILLLIAESRMKLERTLKQVEKNKEDR